MSDEKREDEAVNHQMGSIGEFDYFTSNFHPVAPEKESGRESQATDNERSSPSPTRSVDTMEISADMNSHTSHKCVKFFGASTKELMTNSAEPSLRSENALEEEVKHMKENELVLNETIQELVAENESLREQLTIFKMLVQTLTDEQSSIPTPPRHYSTTNTAVHDSIEWKHSPAEYTALQHELSDTQEELASVQAELDSIRFHSKIGDLIRLPPAERAARGLTPTSEHAQEPATLDLSELLHALSGRMGPLPTDEMSLAHYHDTAMHHLRSMCDRRLPRHVPVSGAKASLSQEETEKMRYGFVVEEEVAVWMATQMENRLG